VDTDLSGNGPPFRGSTIPTFWSGSSLGFIELRFGVKVRDRAKVSTVSRVSCSVSATLRIR